ncbi:MAG: dephospho-CoA kinase [Sphingomonadales bacterium]|jgi:dephospho-CoA kinase
MKILGLTGSIAMGKSTASKHFEALGVPVFDADACVHHLTGPGGRALKRIEAAFPGTTNAQGLDRQKLGAMVFKNPQARTELEAILHPLVWEEREKWLKRQKRRREPLVVLDIPLLFETGAERLCDAIAVVSAPERLQRERVLSRPGMTEEKFLGIKNAQIKDAEKRKRADFVIRTGLGFRHSRDDIKNIIRQMKLKNGIEQEG